MSYTKTEWVNGTTPVNEDNMNKIEDELEALDDGKVDKYTGEQTTGQAIYGQGGSGEKVFFTNSNTYSQGMIPMYGSGGTLLTGTPTANNHAATKKYVDDAVAGGGGGGGGGFETPFTLRVSTSNGNITAEAFCGDVYNSQMEIADDNNDITNYGIHNPINDGNFTYTNVVWFRLHSTTDWSVVSGNYTDASGTANPPLTAYKIYYLKSNVQLKYED